MNKLLKSSITHNKTIWVGLILASSLTSLDGIVSPYIIGTLTNTLTARKYSEVPRIIILYLILFLIIAISYWIWQILWSKIRQRTNLKLRNDAYLSFLTNPQEKNIEKTNSFINMNVTQIEEKYINSIVNLIYCVEQACFSLIYVISINGIVSMAFLICGLLPSIIPKLTQKWVQNGSKKWNHDYESYNFALNEALRNFPVILHFHAFSLFKSRINQKLQTEEQSYYKMSFRSSTASFFSQLSYAVSSILALTIGVIFVLNGQVNVGGLISLFLASDRLTSPIISISQIFNQLNTSTPLINEYNQLVSKKVLINNLTASSGKELIDFCHASFGYNKTLIHDFNLTVLNKEKILIIGPSGIGKSTIFKTLLNEIPLIDGKILINNLDKFNKEIGVISQNSHIFSDSLRFNLCLNKNITDNEIINVLKKVGLSNYANSSSLNQQLGKNGITLSGGEQRKFELARVLLAKKSILLIDEALSGLDHNSAKNISHLLLNFPGTIIEIEHVTNEETFDKYSKVIALKK